MVLVPPDHQGQSLVGALHQTDGLLTGAAERKGVHAHHLVSGLQTDRCRHAALLHLQTRTEVEHQPEHGLAEGFQLNTACFAI